MTRKKYFLLILILGTLSAIGPFSIDMYLPGFPSIAKDLNTTIAKVGLSLSSFFVGISIGQLLYGPLLDRFGRKTPLYFGLCVYIAASVGCTFAKSVEALIVLRFFQAIGSCSGLVASRAMVRDLFPVSENAKVFSLLMLVIGVSPIIAPTVGGYVSTQMSWHYVFIILTIMGSCILAGVYYIVPQTRPPDKSFSLRPPAIVSNFISVFIEPQFYTYAFAGAIASAGLYAYIAGSPYVFMQLHHVSPQQYSWIFATIAIGLIGSSQLNTLLLKKYKSEQIIIGALSCQSLAGFLLLLGASGGWLSVIGTVALIFIFLCCQGFSFPNSSALALAPFPTKAGTASALMGAVQLGLGAVSSALVSWLGNGTSIPMAAVMAACAIMGFSILMVGQKVIRTKATAALINQEAAGMIM